MTGHGGRLARSRGPTLKTQGPIHVLSLTSSGGPVCGSSPGSPGLQVGGGTSPTPLPGAPEGTAGNRGQKCCSFILNPLYRKNPIYVQTSCGPALAQLVGGDTG